MPDERLDPLAQRPPFGLLHVERLGECGNEAGRIVHVGHSHERHTVEVLGSEQPSELGEDARLAHPAWACDRDDPVLADELRERSQIARPAPRSPSRRPASCRTGREPLALALQRVRIRERRAFRRDGVELERPADVLEPEPTRRTTAMSLRFRSCAYASSETITPPGTANDSIRAAMLTASPLSRSGSTITSPTWIPIRTGTSCAASSCWIAIAACTAASALGNMLMLPSPEPLDDRPAARVVVRLDRLPVPLALGECRLLVRLEQSRVADHVGEHHRDEATVAHGATLLRSGPGSSRIAAWIRQRTSGSRLRARRPAAQRGGSLCRNR